MVSWRRGPVENAHGFTGLDDRAKVVAVDLCDVLFGANVLLQSFEGFFARQIVERNRCDELCGQV